MNTPKSSLCFAKKKPEKMNKYFIKPTHTDTAEKNYFALAKCGSLSYSESRKNQIKKAFLRGKKHSIGLFTLT